MACERTRWNFFLNGTKTRPEKTSKSTRLKRLRVHGLLKKVGRCYKYYLTEFGRQVTTMALKLRKMVVIPTLARLASA